jgi:hypothetical protein
MRLIFLLQSPYFTYFSQTELCGATFDPTKADKQGNNSL